MRCKYKRWNYRTYCAPSPSMVVDSRLQPSFVVTDSGGQEKQKTDGGNLESGIPMRIWWWQRRYAVMVTAKLWRSSWQSWNDEEDEKTIHTTMLKCQELWAASIFLSDSLHAINGSYSHSHSGDHTHKSEPHRHVTVTLIDTHTQCLQIILVGLFTLRINSLP